MLLGKDLVSDPIPSPPKGSPSHSFNEKTRTLSTFSCNGLSEDCFVQPVDACCSCSCAINHFHTQYSEGKSCQERFTQRCNSSIHVAEANAEDLKDRDLGYVPKQ